MKLFNFESNNFLVAIDEVSITNVLSPSPMLLFDCAHQTHKPPKNKNLLSALLASVCYTMETDAKEEKPQSHSFETLQPKAENKTEKSET